MRPLIAALADIRRIAVPYFYGEDRRAGRLLLAAVIGFELAIVALNVLFNEWNARFYNSLQDRDWDAFKRELLIFVVLAALFIGAAVYQLYLRMWLRIRWRQWMTENYLNRWLRDATHYRMRLTGDVADNPDQRIAEDLEQFALYAIQLGVGLLGAVVTLASFVLILWRLSGDAALTLFGTEVAIPGYLVWAALFYSIVGTWIAHRIGYPLVRLNFNQQRFEADFRYHLVRMRENGEQVALLAGEGAERTRLGERFSTLVANFRRIMTARKRLTWFTAGYDQTAIVFPFVVVSPAYFTGNIPLGVLTQTASAFGHVQTAFSFFVEAYAQLAEWRAVTQRLVGFEQSIADAERLGATSQIEHVDTSGRALAANDLLLGLPSGVPLVSADRLVVDPGESVLVTGPSGAGKSTLFRALAGIWPFGKGRVAIQRDARMMVLPQRPYLPFGRLDEALTYPNPATAFRTQELTEVLSAVGLAKLMDRLDEEALWPHVLSQGEQQRLSLARALLAAPDILLLDEATSALDEPVEAAMYKLLAERLPGTTVISIGHRTSLNALHRRRFDLKPEKDGTHRVQPGEIAAV